MPRKRHRNVVTVTDKSTLETVPHKILEEAMKAGMVADEKSRSGTFYLVDQSTIYSKINEAFKGKLELMDTKLALKKYPWLQDYTWKAVDEEKDEFTKRVAEDFNGGYFMRILPNAEVTFPLQSCLMITEDRLEQRIHNIIIAEEGSKAHIISSCVQHQSTNRASHIGISEFYVKKDAELNFTMVHSWSEQTLVRPRSAATIDTDGTFVSNYICLRPVKDVQMYPAAYCNGDNSKASFNTILYGNKNSLLDIGSKAVLTGNGSRAEMISRAIARQGSKLILRGMIEGNSEECKGHLECKGLLIDDESTIQSIPELVARRKGAEITHEAAVGKISEKEITYLMTRRLSREQAVSLIIRGFMDVAIMGLPAQLSEQINRIVDTVGKAN
jgi:Fe-S cluster assembly scaffold protein SufB